MNGEAGVWPQITPADEAGSEGFICRTGKEQTEGEHAQLHTQIACDISGS